MSQTRRGITLSHWKHRLDGLPLKWKLYIGLGGLIAALLLVGGMATLTNLSTQRYMEDTLMRQRKLADLAANLSNNLLNIQNQAFEFYEKWTLTGFERDVNRGGFDSAREIHLNPLQVQLAQIRDDIAKMQELGPDGEMAVRLDKIGTNIDAYEDSLLAMADQMQGLGFRDTGEFGELEETMIDMQDLLVGSDLSDLEATLSQIDKNAKGFFLRLELPYVRKTREAILQLGEQIEASERTQISSATRIELNNLLERYYDHFLAAANLVRLLQINRIDLVSQSNLTSTLVQQLFAEQQDTFTTSVEQLQHQQSRTISTTFGLALFVVFGGSAIAYVFTRQVIKPIQALGDAAEKLGKGDLTVRAPVSGGDEIGRTGTAFNLMASRLQELWTDLEQRVGERTAELETTARELSARSAELETAHRNQLEVNLRLEQSIGRSQRRAHLLQANAQVSRAAAQIRDADQLLSEVTELVSQNFGYYHVGVFLIDYAQRYAVLRAASSEGGRHLLARQHRLRVGSQGIVGNVTKTGRPRIALDVGADAVFFDNPDLPDTRSEMAVPLRVGDETIGALDVQSVKEAAFDQEDVDALTALADQIAIAIQNARLFQQAQAALDEAQRVQRLHVQQQWSQFATERPTLTYEYMLAGAPTLEDAPPILADQALREGQLIFADSDRTKDGHVDGKNDGRPRGAPAELAAPIQVRGEIIGVLDLQESEEGRVWTDDEIALIQAVADQLGQTLEGARLFEQTQASLAETQALFETSRNLAGARQIEDIWQAVVEASRQRRADACGLFLFDTQQRETARELLLVTGWDEQRPARLQPGARLPLQDFGLFDNLGPDNPFAISKLAEAKTVDDDTRDLMNTLGFSAALFQPIAARGRWFGLLVVLYQAPHAFGSAETSFYRTLADQAALAFDGQRLLLETQRRAEREQLIRQVTDKVRATSSLETILQTTVQELSRATGLPRAFVRLGTEEELSTTLSRRNTGNDSAAEQTPASAEQ